MEDPHKHPLKNPEYIIAFGVVLISVCALVVSIRQTNIMSEQRALMHEQAKAAVWPRLSMGVSKSHSLEDRSVTDYNINLSNAGVGPAIIKHVQVTYKGASVKSWWELFDQFEMDESIPRYISNSNISRNIVRGGDNVRVLRLTDNLPLANEFYTHASSISYEIYYESIYGDMWKYSLTGTEEVTELLETKPTFPKEQAFDH